LAISITKKYHLKNLCLLNLFLHALQYYATAVTWKLEIKMRGLVHLLIRLHIIEYGLSGAEL